MGTRTAPRKKSKRLHQRLKQRNRPASPQTRDFGVPSATCEQPGQGDVASPPFHVTEDAAAKSSHSVTEPNETCSTIKQVAAAALILGQNVSKTATALGVDRRTIQRWRKFDPEFQQALGEAKQEVVFSSRQELLSLAEAAVGVVETKLSEEQNARVALALLRGIGVISPQAIEAAFLEEQASENEAQATDASPEMTEKQKAAQTPAKKFRAQSATSGAVEEKTAANANEIVSDLSQLSAEQQIALRAFYEGKALSEVAHRVKTTEAIVRNWLCRDRVFFNLLSELQFDRIHQLKHRILAQIKQAMQIVRAAVQAGDERVALVLLRGMGLMR